MYRRNHNSSKTPSSLYPKRENGNMVNKLSKVFFEYSGYIYLILILMALILFVLMCFLFISPLESGAWYNHALNGGI